MKLAMPQFDLLDRAVENIDDGVRSQVFGLLATLYPRNDIAERRNDTRYPFPCFIHLTPVDQDGVTPVGESLVVVGKDISEHGIGFFHQTPLPYRRMIASLQGPGGHRYRFLVNLNWCRFVKGGWYESGGRFLQAIHSPTDES